MNYEANLLKLSGIEYKKDDIKINNFNIHYIEAGEGQPLIFLHGANIGLGAWYQNFAAFAGQFKIYALDLPGAGCSTKVDFKNANFEKTFVNTVEEFIKAKKITNPIIIGHSLGGWTALKMILRGLPVHKLILADPVGLSNNIPLNFQPLAIHPVAKFLTKTVMRPTRENMKKFLADVMSKSSSVSEEFVNYFTQSIQEDKNAHPFLLLGKLFGFLKIRKEFMLSGQLKKISCPVLIISGEKDPLIPVKDIKNVAPQFPDYRLEVFPDTGHALPLERYSEFNKIALNFLQ